MKNYRLLILTLVLSALFLSACSGGASSMTASSWPGVTATEDTVYVAYGPHVYALNAKNGSQQWRFPIEADNKVSYYSAPALTQDGSQLLVGAYDNGLYSINPETGLASGWSFTGATNRYISDLLVTETGIFAPNSDGHVYALDLTGNPLWNEAYSTVEPIWAGPATDGSTIYVAALDHQIHAVNIETGKLRWATDLETAVTGTPAVDNGILYAGTFGSKVFALDTTNGNILWQYDARGWVWASPTVADGVLYVGDVSGVFHALDAATGEEVWAFTADGGIYGGALVAEGHVYFGTDTGKFYALTTEGGNAWFYQLTGKIYSRPATNGEYIFVAATEGDALVTALDMDGVARWPFAPEN